MKAKNIEITIKIESLEDVKKDFELPFLEHSNISDKLTLKDGLSIRANDNKTNILDSDVVWFVGQNLRFDKPTTVTNRKMMLHNFLGFCFDDKKSNNSFWICDIDSKRELKQQRIFIYVDKFTYVDMESPYNYWLNKIIDEYLQKYPN